MSNTDEEMFSELISQILEQNPNKTQLNTLKIQIAKKYQIKRIIKNTEIISHANNQQRDKIIKLLNIKPVRELSGVTVVALFAKPHPCPHGKCIYCPGGIGSEFGDTPQSYTGHEPAAMRAIRNNYDPYLQIFNRLEHYVVNGHFPDKLELIFMGGTFPSLDKKYRDEFVYFTYKAINDFAEEFILIDKNGIKGVDFVKFHYFFQLDEEMSSKTREKQIFTKMLKLKNQNVDFDYKKQIKINETGLIRSIGLTVETKPDWALKKHASEMLEYGATRFEVGVQTLEDDILKKVNRGHSIADTKKSFQIMKDMCFKINAHMMIGLPGSNPQKDIENLKNLFEDADFRPDMLKIYPCLVTKGTGLYEMYKNGKYTPIETKQAAQIIAQSFKYFPRYVRVMRVQRDIPTPNIEEGVKHSNLRQYVDVEMSKNNIISKDIREREIGLRQMQGIKPGKFNLNVEEYSSSGGKEFFIDAVDENDSMIGFIRLRFPAQYGLREEIIEKTALIRELHVYGITTSVGEDAKSHQHKGWGKKLLQKAEEIAKKNDFKKMAIISGVGVREYYLKQGYKLEGNYMVKFL